MCQLSWNLGASTSWNPHGLSRPVMGLLYLYRIRINIMCLQARLWYKPRLILFMRICQRLMIVLNILVHVQVGLVGSWRDIIFTSSKWPGNLLLLTLWPCHYMEWGCQSPNPQEICCFKLEFSVVWFWFAWLFQEGTPGMKQDLPVIWWNA
jgi:hypothetical protein